MFSRSLRALLLTGAALGCAGHDAEARELRVCSDPDNLPYSHASGEGFENKLMKRVGRELGAEVRYVWAPQWRGFLRKSLGAGLCDVVPGIAVGSERVRLTRPYYTSTYVFVTRATGAPITSFADLASTMTVGVQLVGDDGANTPPVEELAERNFAGHLKGYMVWGQSPERGTPLEDIVRAVADGTVDVALVWGPQAGYFATREKAPLKLAPVSEKTHYPMRFDIAMGVRKDNAALAGELDTALVKLAPEIRALLDEYGVPRVQAEQKGAMQ